MAASHRKRVLATRDWRLAKLVTSLSSCTSARTCAPDTFGGGGSSSIPPCPPQAVAPQPASSGRRADGCTSLSGHFVAGAPASPLPSARSRWPRGRPIHVGVQRVAAGDEEKRLGARGTAGLTRGWGDSGGLRLRSSSGGGAMHGEAAWSVSIHPVRSTGRHVLPKERLQLSQRLASKPAFCTCRAWS